MSGQFNEQQLEVHRHLIEPKRMGDLIFSILHERHGLPDWVELARAAGWEPPRSWLQSEREQIRKTAMELEDYKILGIGVDWHLQRIRDMNEMEIIAEQSS